jgi:hypothetical protein
MSRVSAKELEKYKVYEVKLFHTVFQKNKSTCAAECCSGSEARARAVPPRSLSELIVTWEHQKLTPSDLSRERVVIHCMAGEGGRQITRGLRFTNCCKEPM